MFYQQGYSQGTDSAQDHTAGDADADSRPGSLNEEPILLVTPPHGLLKPQTIFCHLQVHKHLYILCLRVSLVTAS